MSIDPALLSLLVCPETRQTLRLATREEIASLNQRIATKELLNRKQEVVKLPMDGALVRSDGTLAYPIRDEIPDLLVDEGLLLVPREEA
jgi:uncharacterized protein YbaR (Trm112 family)